MATTRMVKTVIWEDEWFFDLSDKAQRLYLYLITNKNTEISGMYRLPMREMAMYMKHKEDVVKKLLKELQPKVAYADGWVIIPKYTEHQNVANNVKVQLSIEKYLKTVPPHILKIKSEIINHKSETIDSLSIGYKEKDSKEVKKPINKGFYGEFKTVKLTAEEYEKVVEKLGTATANELITELDSYIASKGAKYKSHYATLLAWARRKGIDTRKTSKYAGL
jgi:hypothetical protein